MLEKTPTSVSVKVSKEVYDALNDEQNRIRRDTGQKPPLAELLERAWECYQSKRDTGECVPMPLQVEDGDASAVPLEFRDRIAKLIKILSSEDQQAINAVVANIDLFCDRLRTGSNVHKVR